MSNLSKYTLVVICRDSSKSAAVNCRGKPRQLTVEFLQNRRKTSAVNCRCFVITTELT